MKRQPFEMLHDSIARMSDCEKDRTPSGSWIDAWHGTNDIWTPAANVPEKKIEALYQAVMAILEYIESEHQESKDVSSRDMEASIGL